MKKKVQIYKLFRCSDKGKKIKGQFVSLVELVVQINAGYGMRLFEVDDNFNHKYIENNRYLEHWCFKPSVSVYENGSVQISGLEFLEDRESQVAAIFLLVPFAVKEIEDDIPDEPELE